MESRLGYAIKQMGLLNIERNFLWVKESFERCLTKLVKISRNSTSVTIPEEVSSMSGLYMVQIRQCKKAIEMAAEALKMIHHLRSSSKGLSHIPKQTTYWFIKPYNLWITLQFFSSACQFSTITLLTFNKTFEGGLGGMNKDLRSACSPQGAECTLLL